MRWTPALNPFAITIGDRSSDRGLNEAVAPWGEPSVWIGGRNPLLPKTLAYATDDPTAPLVLELLVSNQANARILRVPAPIPSLSYSLPVTARDRLQRSRAATVPAQHASGLRADGEPAGRTTRAHQDAARPPNLLYVLRDLLLGLFGLAMGGGMLYAVLRPVPAIWRGDGSRIPILPWRQTGQTYLAFLLWTVPVSIALAVFGADILFYAFTGNKDVAAAIAKPAVGLALVGTPFILVNGLIDVFKRPRFLIPPPYCQRRLNFDPLSPVEF